MGPRPCDAPPPYGTLVFDCDSTLSRVEGIDELAGTARAEIAALTARAMEGGAPLEEVYGRRLERIQPTRAQVGALGERYIETLLTNVPELVCALRSLEKRVAIVSGGLRPAVAALAEHLQVPDCEVFAVGIDFDARGEYAGFESDSPLARSGGKLEVLRAIAAAPRTGGLCLVGDGVTDLEAAPVLDRFVAFGGVERRTAVFDVARITCAEPDFAALLPHLLSPSELQELRSSRRHEALFAAAAPHLD